MEDYISALELGHLNGEVFVQFIAEAELETEKDFMRMMGLTIPN